MVDGDETDRGFLARWSERKLGAGHCDDVDGAPARSGVGETDSLLEQSDREDEVPVLTDADMPALESLDEGSDYSGFLSPGVTQDLRRKALSQLFHAARFNVADGLDDYAEDFCSFAPLGDIVTADMRHRMEEAAKRLLAEEENAAQSFELTQAQEVTDENTAVKAPGEGEEREDRDST